MKRPVNSSCTCIIEPSTFQSTSSPSQYIHIDTAFPNAIRQSGTRMYFKKCKNKNQSVGCHGLLESSQNIDAVENRV